MSSAFPLVRAARLSAASLESRLAAGGSGTAPTAAALNRENPPDAGTASAHAAARIQVELSHAASASASRAEPATLT